MDFYKFFIGVLTAAGVGLLAMGHSVWGSAFIGGAVTGILFFFDTIISAKKS